MILTKTEIRMLLGELAWKEVWTDGQYRLQKIHFGYSAEDDMAQLQGKLSIMMEAKTRAAKVMEDERIQ